MPKDFNFVFNAIEMLPHLALPAEYAGKECSFQELAMHYAKDSQHPPIVNFFTKTTYSSCDNIKDQIYKKYESAFQDPAFIQTLIKIILSARCHALSSILRQPNTPENTKKALTTVQTSLNGLLLIISILKTYESPIFQTILAEAGPNLVSDTYCILYNISGGLYLKCLEKDNDLIGYFESSLKHIDSIAPKWQAKSLTSVLAKQILDLLNYRHIAVVKYHMALEQYDKAHIALSLFPTSFEMSPQAYTNFLQEKESLEAELYQIYPLSKFEQELRTLEEEQAQLNAQILELKEHAQQVKEAEQQEKMALKKAIEALKQSNDKLRKCCTAAQIASDVVSVDYTQKIEDLKRFIEDLKATQQALNKPLPKKMQIPHQRSDAAISEQITALKAKKTERLARQKELEQQLEQARKTPLLPKAVKTEDLERLKTKLEALRAENTRLHTANLSFQVSVAALAKERDSIKSWSSLAYADLNRDMQGLHNIATTLQSAHLSGLGAITYNAK